MNRADFSNSDDQQKARLFAGIACTGLPGIDALLHELKTTPGLEHGIQVVAPENLHITLKFLGPVPCPAVAQIAAVLDRVAATTARLVLTLAGTGSFTNAVWLGVEPPEALIALAGAINDELQPLGFQRDAKAFVPHLTLARLKQPAEPQLQAWIEERRQQSWASLQISQIHLYQSVTFAAGASYSILHTARLNTCS